MKTLLIILLTAAIAHAGMNFNLSSSPAIEQLEVFMLRHDDDITLKTLTPALKDQLESIRREGAGLIKEATVLDLWNRIFELIEEGQLYKAEQMMDSLRNVGNVVQSSSIPIIR